MSWKISTVTLALFAVVGTALSADCPIQPAGAGCCGGAGHWMPTAADAQTDQSKADQKLIIEQKTCPVSGEPLGSMGAPVKVTAKGRTVFLCCAGCEKKFLADPGKYFKKIDNRFINEQKICPVSGQPLGSMGTPVRVTVKDRSAFLCCEGCKKKFLADPDKYFKKIDEKKNKEKKPV
jgi:YHS domain-containing protein